MISFCFSPLRHSSHETRQFAHRSAPAMATPGPGRAAKKSMSRVSLEPAITIDRAAVDNFSSSFAYAICPRLLIDPVVDDRCCLQDRQFLDVRHLTSV